MSQPAQAHSSPDPRRYPSDCRHQPPAWSIAWDSAVRLGSTDRNHSSSQGLAPVSWKGQQTRLKAMEETDEGTAAQRATVHPPVTTRPCSVAASLDIVGERWSLLAIREMGYGVHHFTKIAGYTGASRDILADRLRKLEAAHIVERRQYSQHPRATSTTSPRRARICFPYSSRCSSGATSGRWMNPPWSYGTTAVIAWRSNWPAGTAIRRWPGPAWSCCRSAAPERVEYVQDSASGSRSGRAGPFHRVTP